jgi:hypothetical protein
MPQVHAVLIGDELFQPRKVFDRRQLTNPLSQGARHAMPTTADLRIGRRPFLPTRPAAVTGSFHDGFSAQGLNRDTAASAAFHGTPTAHGASDVSCHLVKTALHNHSLDPLAKSPGRLFDLDRISRNGLTEISDFAPINSNGNLNKHHALLGNTGLPAPGIVISKEGISFCLS